MALQRLSQEGDALGAIVKKDCEQMAAEESDAAWRIAENRQRVRVCAENSLFLEGLYAAFPSEAATTTCIPFDPQALKALKAGAAGGVLTYSMNGVGTMQVLQHHAAQGLRPVGCNFAHPLRAGGHYEQGSRTQEEALCRQAPNFWPSLVSIQATAGFCDPSGQNAGHHVDDGPARRHAQIKFTSNVHVMRDPGSGDGIAVLPEEQQFRVAIVTVGAPCFHPSSLGVPDAEARTQARAFLSSERGSIAAKEAMQNTILGPLTVDPSLEVLVLGGWGTGAYRLPWDLVMTLFRDAIIESNALQIYREIHFPLFEGEDSGRGDEFEGIWAAANVRAQRSLRECERREGGGKGSGKGNGKGSRFGGGRRGGCGKGER